MDWEDDSDMLAFDVQFALRQHRYKPPARFDLDPQARERYYASLGKAVVEQLKLCWNFSKKPPRQ